MALATLATPAAASALPPDTRVETYSGGPTFPVEMAWAPGTNRIFFIERFTGDVRILDGRRLLDVPCVHLDVANSGERGGLGLALDPDFAHNHRLYVFYTNASPLENRLTRFVVKGNRCVSPETILGDLRAEGENGRHNGGKLLFYGGKLFVATGDAESEEHAQDLGDPEAKILRLNPDGSIPAGNPSSEPGNPSPVWAYGLRSPFGLARIPGRHVIYATDNGPECDDKLIIVQKGANYGWGPGAGCGQPPIGPDPRPSLVSWTPPIAPTDLLWYSGRMKSLAGALYMGDYNQGRIHRFDLDPSRTRVERETIVYDPGTGDAEGILDVSVGPGGWLYFVTPTAIKRIVPAG